MRNQGYSQQVITPVEGREFGTKAIWKPNNASAKIYTEFSGKAPLPIYPIIGMKVSHEHVWHQANTQKIGLSYSWGDKAKGSSKYELKGVVKTKLNIFRYTGNPLGE